MSRTPAFQYKLRRLNGKETHYFKFKSKFDLFH